MLLDVRCHFLPFFAIGGKNITGQAVESTVLRLHSTDSHVLRCAASVRRFLGVGNVFVSAERKTAYRGCKRAILRYVYFEHKKAQPDRPGIKNTGPGGPVLVYLI